MIVLKYKWNGVVHEDWLTYLEFYSKPNRKHNTAREHYKTIREEEENTQKKERQHPNEQEQVKCAFQMLAFWRWIVLLWLLLWLSQKVQRSRSDAMRWNTRIKSTSCDYFVRLCECGFLLHCIHSHSVYVCVLENASKNKQSPNPCNIFGSH